MVEDVCRVHTAFCNLDGRLRILHLLENECVKFAVRDNPIVIRLYLQWLILRNLRVQKLVIKANGMKCFETENLTCCLKYLDELNFKL